MFKSRSVSSVFSGGPMGGGLTSSRRVRQMHADCEPKKKEWGVDAPVVGSSRRATSAPALGAPGLRCACGFQWSATLIRRKSGRCGGAPLLTPGAARCAGGPSGPQRRADGSWFDVAGRHCGVLSGRCVEVTEVGSMWHPRWASAVRLRFVRSFFSFVRSFRVVAACPPARHRLPVPPAAPAWRAPGRLAERTGKQKTKTQNLAGRGCALAGN